MFFLDGYCFRVNIAALYLLSIIQRGCVYKVSKQEVLRLVNSLLVRHRITDWLEGQILHGITEISINASKQAELIRLNDCSHLSRENL
jgi:hypothetical protein